MTQLKDLGRSKSKLRAILGDAEEFKTSTLEELVDEVAATHKAREDSLQSMVDLAYEQHAALKPFGTSRPGLRWTLIRADGHEDCDSVRDARAMYESFPGVEIGTPTRDEIDLEHASMHEPHVLRDEDVDLANAVEPTVAPGTHWQNVAICETCWSAAERSEGPIRMKDADIEECAACHDRTISGIYVRALVNSRGEIIMGWP